MMVFKKAIPRRTFLRGVGTTLALPFLDGMVPAFASTIERATRFSVVYVANGVMMDKWTPVADGAAFELTPILEPLAPFRDRLLVISGLTNKAAFALPGEDGGAHSRSSGAFLTGVPPKKTETSNTDGGISVDQIVAHELGKQTQLASLELGLDSNELIGGCETGWSCAYINTLSWRNPTTPMPIENQPRLVFERLFGDIDSTDPAERRARFQENRSILDSVTESMSHLLNRLGPSDRAKFTQYTDAIRDVERRIQMAELQASRELPVIERPAGIPATFGEHAKIMFDLQVLAYQCDLTRVITCMMARETSSRTYNEIGVADPHHPLTHHQGDKEKIAKVVKINIYHAQMFAYFLEKLRATPDGDGSLLDHTVIVYGGGISDGNQHSYTDLPILLAGGKANQFKGGRHLSYPMDTDTPLANLHLTVLGMLGIPVENFGDSTGRLKLLSLT
jgi:Protein of unknown function (DUF1552)